MENKQTAVEWLISQIIDGEIDPATNAVFLKKHINKIEVFEQAKAMERKQIGYSEEDITEMLFMALNEPQEECCTTHTKDSIVRKVLKTLKQDYDK